METKQEKTTTETANSTVPDGGYGWVIIAASFMCHFIADGISYSFGIFFSELEATFNSSKSATSWIASLFVGMSLIGGPVAGLFVTKYGCRATTILGGLITSIGMLLSSFASSLEMLTITYGVIAGFGLAFIYVPASVIPSFWFEKKRALATGIAASGSGLGTFAIAPLIEFLLDEYGWRGTMLVMSGITLNFLVFGALFREVPVAPPAVRQSKRNSISMISLPSNASMDDSNIITSRETRVLSSGAPSRRRHSTNSIYPTEQFELPDKLSNKPDENCQSTAQLLLSSKRILSVSRRELTIENIFAPENQDKKKRSKNCNHLFNMMRRVFSRDTLTNAVQSLREMCDVTLLTVPVYLMFFISNFLLECASDLPYIYLPDYAITNNISRPSFLIAIIGIVSTFGQILFGYLGDRKCLDILLLFGGSITLCGISVTLVPVMHDFASLATFSVAYGLFLSACFSLETVVLVKILSLEQLTKAYGLLLLGQGVGSLIGPPIGGLLIDITGEYLYTFLFTGLAIIISGVLATAIFFVRKCSHTRSVSECTEIVPADNSALSA